MLQNTKGAAERVLQDGGAKDAQAAARLAALSGRHAALRERGIRARAEAERLESELQREREAAVREWGTDDPAELERLHVARLAEQESRLAEYAALLDGAEAELSRLSAALSSRASA